MNARKIVENRVIELENLIDYYRLTLKDGRSPSLEKKLEYKMKQARRLLLFNKELLTANE